MLRAGQATGGSATAGGATATPPAEAELQTGIQLTSQGKFAEAIPHLLAAQNHVAPAEEFAADFDLSLCYVGTRQFAKASATLLALSQQHPKMANVEDLLAQAYVGGGDSRKAYAALERAAALDPKNEDLYRLVADECLDSSAYALGLRVADLGLRSLPNSAALHYQRGLFLSLLDRGDIAVPEFQLAAKLSPGTAIAFMGQAQAELIGGNQTAAAATSRAGLKQFPDNYLLLASLGRALLDAGATPGQPEFAEALEAMEKAVAQQPYHADTQVTLGKLYLMAGKTQEAIEHLEQARQLDPQNTAVYAQLADAYRRTHEFEKMKQVLAILARINQEKAESYRTAPGEEGSGYVGGGMKPAPRKVPHHN